MNDAAIRKSLHEQLLKPYYARRDVLVVDELGLQHGKCRADVAVINGSLVGYEIKSDEDSLNRLPHQISIYNAVFDRVWIVVGSKHFRQVLKAVPEWWGIISCAQQDPGGTVRCKISRAAKTNKATNGFSVAQLLWRGEAEEILISLGASPKILRQRRAVLYEELVKSLTETQLKREVTTRLKQRRSWRCP